MDENEAYLDRLVDESSLTAYLESELGGADSVTVAYHDEGVTRGEYALHVGSLE